MSQFKESLINAARQAREDGAIGPLQFLHIRAACMNSHFVSDAEKLVKEEAAAKGQAIPKSTDASGKESIDWAAILEFIKGLIPLIMQLISLFKP